MLKCSLLFCALVAVVSAGCGCVNTGAAIPGIPTGFCLNEAAGNCDSLNGFGSTPNQFQCQCTECNGNTERTACPISGGVRCSCADSSGVIQTGVTPAFCFPFDFARTACPGATATTAATTAAPAGTTAATTTAPASSASCCCLPGGAAPTDNCLAGVDPAVCASSGATCEAICDCVPNGDDPVTGPFLPGVRASLCIAGQGFCRPAPTAAPSAAPTAAPITAAPTAPPTCCCLAFGADVATASCIEIDQAFCLKGRGSCRTAAPTGRPTPPPAALCCCEFNGANAPCLENFEVTACVDVSGKTCRTAAPTAAPTEAPTNAPTAAPTPIPTCCCFPFGAGISDTCRANIPETICIKGGGICDIPRCCCVTTGNNNVCVANFPQVNCELSGFFCQQPPTPAPTAAPTAVGATAAPTVAPDSCCCHFAGVNPATEPCVTAPRAICQKAGGAGCTVERCCCDAVPGGPCIPNFPKAECEVSGFLCEQATCLCTPSDGTPAQVVPRAICIKGDGVCDGAAPITCDCQPSDGSAVQPGVPRTVCEKGNGVCVVSTTATTTTTRGATTATTQAATTRPSGSCNCIAADGTVVENVAIGVCAKGNGRCEGDTTRQTTQETTTQATTQATSQASSSQATSSSAGTTGTTSRASTTSTTTGGLPNKSTGAPGTAPAGSSCSASNDCASGCCRLNINTETLTCQSADGSRLCL